MAFSNLYFENGRPLLIAGLRSPFGARPWEDVPALWRRFETYFGKIPAQAGRTAYGLCFTTSEGVEYLAGVEVSRTVDLPNE